MGWSVRDVAYCTRSYGHDNKQGTAEQGLKPSPYLGMGGALGNSLTSKSQNFRIVITDDNNLWTLWAASYAHSLVSSVFLDNLKLLRFDIKSDKPCCFDTSFIYPITVVPTVKHNHYLSHMLGCHETQPCLGA